MIFKTHHANKQGLSPVLGTALMLGSILILGAIVSTFVLGLTDNLEKNSSNASVQFDETPYSVNSEGKVEIKLLSNPESSTIRIESPNSSLLYMMHNTGETETVRIQDTADYSNKILADGDVITVISVTEDSRSVVQRYETKQE